MEWGDKIDFLRNISIERGELTDSLKKRPMIDQGLMLIWSGFWQLSSSRDFSVRYSKDRKFIVMLPIKLSEIVACCELLYIHDTCQRIRFTSTIHAMDRVYLDKINPKVA